MLSEKAIMVLEDVSMLDRYHRISNRFQNRHGEFKVDPDRAFETIRNINSEFKYNKKESFYGLKELRSGCDFRFNVSINHEVVEPIIWGAFHGEQIGGSVAATTRRYKAYLNKEDLSITPFPKFNSYDELEMIVNLLYDIYTDFKVSCVRIWQQPII